MELDVDFIEIHLNATKMRGLDAYLYALRNSGFSYTEGLNRAKQYVLDNGGDIEHLDDGVTILSFAGTQAHCFQPYDDIDRFYYEI